MEESKAELKCRYERRLSQLQQLNESLDTSEMFESQEAELDKMRNTQVVVSSLHLFDPSSPKNDQHQIYPCSINAL